MDDRKKAILRQAILETGDDFHAFLNVMNQAIKSDLIDPTDKSFSLAANVERLRDFD